MTQDMTLEQLIHCVIDLQRSNGHTELYINQLQKVYNRLLKLSEEMGESHFSDELTAAFLADDKNSYTGEYCHSRFLSHHRAISFLQSYMKTGEVIVNRYSAYTEPSIPEDFSRALKIYDKSESESGLSKSSLIKNRKPIFYLLEYMAGLGYETLSDIQSGDTLRAIQDILENHYSASSLCTAISGMRRFYRMFPELYPYRLEIPDRMIRERTIIDTYTEEEQEKIKAVLFSDDITRRDAAIGLLCFETGLRAVDIKKMKLTDIDWKHNVIHIIQSKTKEPLNLPLRSSYGNAMVDYLLSERPECESEVFFLSARAPFIELKTITHIIKNIILLSGIDTKGRGCGPRMFRHNAASTMVKKGVPLPAISEELGHKNLDSTMVYIANDKDIMASLTLPLPPRG